MDRLAVLKALADDSRMKLLTLLLERSYCVRALAWKLELSEATVSQHLKVLREAGLLVGEKHGYFMHYEVQRDILLELARELEALAEMKRVICSPEIGGCPLAEQGEGHARQMLKEARKKHCPFRGDEAEK